MYPDEATLDEVDSPAQTEPSGDPPLPPEHYLNEPNVVLELRPIRNQSDPLLSPMVSLTVQQQAMGELLRKR